MPHDFSQELNKWDEFYNSMPKVSEDNFIDKFGQEFATKITNLLPEGGTVLEMGCGSGWQSLALAQTGKFQVTLLDFSSKALERAKTLFQKENLSANFILADAFEPVDGSYDLVFNAGVIEHYGVEEQKKLLHSMKLSSGKYVLVLAPNRLCFWYWHWRVQYTSQDDWPFGSESPVTDLSALMRESRLNFVGQSYMAEDWTESFIEGITGVSDEFRRLALKVHRSPILSPHQKCYLLAGLGSVAPVEEIPSGWDLPTLDSQPVLDELVEALALSLSDNVREKIKLNEIKTSKEKEVSQLLALHEQYRLTLLDIQREKETEIAQLRASEEKLKLSFLDGQRESGTEILQLRASEEQLKLSLLNVQRKLELDEQKHQEEVQKLKDKFTRELEMNTQRVTEDIESEKQILNQMEFKLNEKDQTIASLSAKVNEIYSSTGWKMVQSIWKMQVWLRSYRIFAWLEQKIKTFLRNIKKRPLNTDSPLPVLHKPISVEYNQPLKNENQGFFPLIENLVILLTPTFFDWNGNNMFYGGAERYLIELSRLIQEIGFSPVIVQCGNFNWTRYYFDVKVIGLEVKGGPEGLTNIIEQINPKAALLIYSPFFLASGKLDIPSIGISHGVYWDDMSFHKSSAMLNKTINNLLQNFEKVDQIVAVDTNTINWIRTIKNELAAKAFYIPNFVDLEQFRPANKLSDRVIILYPRRLYKPRGFWLLAEILPGILNKYPQVDFHFVGKADLPEETQVQEWSRQYPDRVRHYSLSPSDMHLAYQQADIAVIPTIHSEGTSLSCLEAMASQNAVISTNVGGLTNLIIDGFNGIMIEPNAKALNEALEILINQPEFRQELARHGRQVIEHSFTLKHWKDQWKSILGRFLPSQPSQKTNPVKTLVFPYTGIAWEGIKQRPHHIASEFIKKGYEVFWFDPNSRKTPVSHVHLLNLNDDLYLENPLLLIYYPYNYEEIRKFKNPTVIYDILDDISIFDHVTWDEPGKTARDYYVRLLGRADIVLSSSHTLFQKIIEVRPDVLYVPNGVYLNHFNPDNCSVASEINNLPRPIIGFHGAIASWVNITLILEVARLRTNYQFVLVGPVSIPDEIIKDLKMQGNIHFIDSVPYEQVPLYVKGFDVGIMPFELSTLTHAVRPLKVLEYLSMGKPVVATPIEEMRDWPGMLFAETSNEFADCLDKAIKTGGLIGDSQIIETFLKESTWSEVTRGLMEKIDLLSTPDNNNPPV